MVQIVRDPEVVRMENYVNINRIMNPDFYIKPAGTAAFIYSSSGRYKGILFLNWDNHEVKIKGEPEELWDTANRIEAYGYKVTIESPYEIEKCGVVSRRNVTEQHNLLPEHANHTILSRIKSAIW